MKTMKRLLIVTFVVTLATVCTSKILATEKHERTSSNVLKRPSNIYALGEVRCGDWQYELTGSIYYKPFERVEANERCVWVIGVPRALGYAFSLQYLGEPTNQPGSGQELIISGVKHNLTVEPEFKSELPTATGFFNVTDCHIVIISFHTESLENVDNSTGFVLLYETIFETSDPEIVLTPISLTTTHQILPSPVFDFKYPVSVANYDMNELAAFVFPPSNSVYGCSSNYISFRGNIACNDRLHVYHFNLSDTEAVGHWQHKEMVCGATTWTNLYDDLVLIFFVSDAATAGAGFYLNYLGC